jgi:hypothetical protein
VVELEEEVVRLTDRAVHEILDWDDPRADLGRSDRLEDLPKAADGPALRRLAEGRDERILGERTRLA